MEFEMALSTLVVGIIIVLAILIKFGFRVLSLPAMVGFFLLGFAIRLVNVETGYLTKISIEILEFLGTLGIIALLFRVGLESKLGRLIKWIPKATFIWVGDVVLSAFIGFVVAYYLLGFSLIPSLFTAAAFTPTSVGISVAIWEEMKAIKTAPGEIMLDVAELDDISGILLMGVLFALAPILHDGMDSEVLPILLESTGAFLMKIIIFGGACILFAKFVERSITRNLKKIHAGESGMLVIVGIGLMVAAMASFLGFSVAIGAFFAGLIFSSDPQAVKIDTSFESLHEMFVPFFFVGIGMKVEHTLAGAALWPGLILLVAAAASKFMGSGLPAWIVLNPYYAVMIGFSMIPRAEIALIIMQRGLNLGSWAVPPELFADFVLISAVSAVVVPVILRKLIKKKPKQLKYKPV